MDFPLLKVFPASVFSKNFKGSLYYLPIGQGLGDTANGLGLYRALSKRFPDALHIVYKDPRWDILTDQIQGDRTILRNYVTDFDYRRSSQTKGAHRKEQFDKLKKNLTRELKTLDGNGYRVAGDMASPERLAKGRSVFEEMWNEMGLILEEKEQRPWIPIDQKDWDESTNFLIIHKLKDVPFIVIAPHTEPDKRWPTIRFSELGKKLYSITGARIVVMGFRESESPTIPDALYAFDLSLPIISAIIAQSRLFIGHDSGLTHIAASFDIPVIDIMANRTLPPFEVRPLTPYANIIIEPEMGKKGFISMETVLSVALELFKIGAIRNPPCPVCCRPMDYTRYADSYGLARACVCGLTVWNEWEKESPKFYRLNVGKVTASESFPDPGKGEILELAENDNDEFFLENSLRDYGRANSTIQVLFKEKGGVRKTPLEQFDSPAHGDIVWSFDSVLFLFQQIDFYLSDVRILGPEKFLLTFSRDIFPGKSVRVPWCGKSVKLKNIHEYFSYYAWSAWCTPERWEYPIKMAEKKEDFKVAKNLSIQSWGYLKKARTISRIIRYSGKEFYASIRSLI